MSELAVDDSATRWSVPVADVDAAIAARPLVVLLHGLGADEHDLAGLVPALPPAFLYASVRAPVPIRSPGRGFAWFPPLLQQGISADPEIVNAAARGLLTWLDRTQARARSHGPVALLGFSQGAAMSVQLLRHAPELFAGAVALSGFVAPGLVGGDEALSQIRPPVLWGYDPADPVVTTPATDRLRTFLAGHTRVDERRYPGAGHGITADEAADVAGFLSDLLGP
jgi:phospholipase/carboxylesterase